MYISEQYLGNLLDSNLNLLELELRPSFKIKSPDCKKAFDAYSKELKQYSKWSKQVERAEKRGDVNTIERLSAKWGENRKRRLELRKAYFDACEKDGLKNPFSEQFVVEEPSMHPLGPLIVARG